MVYKTKGVLQRQSRIFANVKRKIQAYLARTSKEGGVHTVLRSLCYEKKGANVEPSGSRLHLGASS